MINKQKLVFIAITFSLFLTFIIYNAIVAENNFISMQFNGKVENVSYDIKGIPTVKVAGKQFYLGINENFEYQIKEGDSIIKMKGQGRIELIKESGKIINFN